MPLKLRGRAALQRRVSPTMNQPSVIPSEVTASRMRTSYAVEEHAPRLSKGSVPSPHGQPVRVLALRRTLSIAGQIFLACLLAIPALSASPQDLLAVGHVDELIQTLQTRLSADPDAESYNLLCRA